MCGIAGFWGRVETNDGALLLLATMESALKHRGPDDSGTWFDASSGVGFAHRRLAIVDLSPLGRQPMHSASGRYTICYNGEVYNFGAIRAELEREGVGFRGHSDTEVMLAAIERWGLDAAVERFVGMFAFALWDAHEQALFLVRDRIGVKPVYFGVSKGVLLFASELKALCAHPAFDRSIDRDALAIYLRLGYIPAPCTIYRGIRKQQPGTIVRLRRDGDGWEVTDRPYWSARSIAEKGARKPLHLADDEAIQQLDTLLREAVRLRMIADVPLGAFLSGGIDSSTVVALMQAQSDRPVRTFSIGFAEAEYNEAPYARAVAHHLGTDHTELILTPGEALAVTSSLAATDAMRRPLRSGNGSVGRRRASVDLRRGRFAPRRTHSWMPASAGPLHSFAATGTFRRPCARPTDCANWRPCSTATRPRSSTGAPSHSCRTRRRLWWAAPNCAPRSTTRPAGPRCPRSTATSCIWTW
jgi:asparagine synthase (glutamine-hydrolysing)